ncbi:uncharacterized protein L969DRAFT_91119 [Mixia osmundae IAM 14324]|uniref:Major facilitator superfamily (MFS) profile domain-containing protein n=1 Tax=Mixia osmundae (strain CBS 9802 / IAM 14324 / JCM 22182 / KY 12970) TaxID=764103 RepID=G7E4E8_MIXOS|nr:uncharacterized protein L969DRAFT_91119 [Mixia osmundae IAM 14324]KEI36274.1 hypothetical protein L969DRAFT_91119 [Mixia osmundae IAM 14324]GAA97708.1 hypothetical protein E5Q_04387 [Mixia osmundae IAM 14324]
MESLSILTSPRRGAGTPARGYSARSSVEQPAEEVLVDDEAEDVSSAFMLRLAVVAGTGGLLFGIDTGIIASVLVTIGDDLGQELSEGQQEMIVSATIFGAILGSLAAGLLSDWMGRKKTVLLASVFFTIGSLEQAASQVVKELVLGRVIVGLGVGIASMVIPVYFAELAPARFRGRLVSALVVLITGGQVLAYVIGAAFANVQHGWRWMLGLSAVPPILQLIMSFSLPETPRYLLKIGQLARVRQVLASVYPALTEDDVQAKVDAMRLAMDSESREKPGTREAFKRLWSDLANRRALIVAIGLQFFQQATGFNTLLYYSAVLLKSAGFDKPAAMAIFIALSNWICTMIALRLIDRVGRRTMLLRTLASMTAGAALLAFSFIFINTHQAVDLQAKGASAWAYLALIGMIWFCASYALGLGNIPWLVQSEIFAYDVRALANSLATATNWIANFVVASTFLHLTAAISPAGAFFLFGLLTICALIFVYLLLPETRGLDLESCRRLFDSSSTADYTEVATS